jgi:hypothetical protein
MNSVIEIIKSGVNVNLTMTREDLDVYSRSLIEQTKKEFLETVESEKAKKHITVKEAEVILGVNASTLWRWNKSGFLETIELAGGRRYILSEVMALLQRKEK